MEEINLYDLLRYYAKKWLTILTIVLLGAIVGVGYTYYFQKPQYTSTATLLLVGTNRSSSQESVVLNNYVELFKSRSVLETVISERKYNQSYNALAANTTAVNVRNTDIINVSITTSDANTSKALLETAIGEFREESEKLYGDTSIEINVVDEADAPKSPTNVKPVQQIGLAVSGAFVLALVMLFFVYDYKTSQQNSRKMQKDVSKKKSASVSEKASSKKS